MGDLAFFRLDSVASCFPHFIETGTGHGTGVDYARSHRFLSIESVEIEPYLVAKAEQRYKDDPRVHIHLGDSATTLRSILSKIPQNRGALLWLDAHADVEAKLRADKINGPARLTLVRELEAVRDVHPLAMVLVDDARIYENGPWGSGSIRSPSGLPDDQRQADHKAIRSVLSATHQMRVWYDEEGYIGFMPHGVAAPELNTARKGGPSRFGRLLWHRDKEPRFDAIIDPSSAQFHLWLAEVKNDHGDLSARELGRIETKVSGLASRARVMWNPFTGEFRKVSF
jgi:hypothetical protein